MKTNVSTIVGAFFFLLFVVHVEKCESSSSAPGRSLLGRNNFWSKLFAPRNRKTAKRTDDEEGESQGDKKENMGQAMRIVKYDRAENEKNAIPALNLLVDGESEAVLNWHRLDDGVMGGQSESLHSCLDDGSLQFAGEINTNGGGFCSIRSPLPSGFPPNTTAIRLRFEGDGKTYKLTLSDGTRSRFGPSKRAPSWQCDIPTTKKIDNANGRGGGEEEITIPFSSLKPSWGPSPVSDQTAIDFDASSMREIGIMLSLKLSDGSNNPVETFGSGIFPFSLKIVSIQPIVGLETEAA